MKIFIKQLSLIMVLSLLITTVFCFAASADTANPPSTLYYGDVDMDGSVTVKDATAVQKGLAGIIYLTSVQRFLAEPDLKEVSVKSATAIQKHLAGIDGVICPYGDTKELPDSDLFTCKISDKANFSDTEILIASNSKFGEMTLEDFPEYEFTAISSFADLIEKEYKFYTLTLKNPGRESVMEAIEVLTYRANIDLIIVQPNYMYILE